MVKAANDNGTTLIADWDMRAATQRDGRTVVLKAAATTILTLDPQDYPDSPQPECNYEFRIRFRARRFPPAQAIPELLASVMQQATGMMSERKPKRRQ